jgi:outer membrane protein OmpA-like peptidoglycan-associated protein
LRVTARGLPEKPSLKESEPLKMQENRRVELIPNDYSLFNPITLESRSLLNPIEKIKFEAKIFSANEISNYTLSVSCGDEIIHTVTVNNPKYVDGIVTLTEEWKMQIEPEKKRNDYKILFIATDRLNRSKSYRMSFPIYFNTAEELAALGKNRQINKYNLILFDFSAATVGSRNSTIIQNIIKKTNPESPVTVEGFTDITGSEDFNEKLSLRRAESVKQALNLPNSKVISSENSVLLYDNDNPEGRFYCRTVEITVMPID